MWMTSDTFHQTLVLDKMWDLKWSNETLKFVTFSHSTLIYGNVDFFVTDVNFQENINLGKVTNIEYGNIDFEKVNFESLISTRS